MRRLDLGRFLRVKTEIDKEAMRDDADTARLVPGVTIGSAGEDFTVKPAEVDIASGAGSGKRNGHDEAHRRR